MRGEDPLRRWIPMTRYLMPIALLCVVMLPACAGPPSIDSVMQRGDRAFARGDYGMAVVNYEDVTDRFPGDWEAQYKLGLSLLHLGQYTQARRSLEIAHTRQPYHQGVVDGLAEALYKQGNTEQLYAFLRAQIEESQSVNACLRMARYCLELNDPDSAKWAIDTAVEWDRGRTAEPQLLAADLAERLGDSEEVLRHLRDGYRNDPYNARINERLRDYGEVPGPTMP